MRILDVFSKNLFSFDCEATISELFATVFSFSIILTKILLKLLIYPNIILIKIETQFYSNLKIF